MTETVNVPLLRKMVEWVEEQEQRTEGREWFQESWVSPGRELIGEFNVENWCDTACCVAGKVALMEGWTPVPYGEGLGFKSELVRDGKFETARDIATKVLGLDEGEAMCLFAADNTAADIRRVAEWIAEEPL